MGKRIFDGTRSDDRTTVEAAQIMEERKIRAHSLFLSQRDT